MIRPSLVLLLALPVAAANRIAIIAPPDLPAPALHGLKKLQQAARALGYSLVQAAGEADYVITAGLAPATLKTAESLSIRRSRVEGKPAVALKGADARGLMYAALDTAGRLGSGDPFAFVRDTDESPSLTERGISMYTMQRAYFESRLYDQRHWERYFDMLAADRINSFVVIFGYENGGFMAPLYPYFFNTEGFPQVEMVGITPQQQARNTAAFKTMIRIAHERGIDITAGIWDHIYRGGVQGGGIPGASDNAGKRVPGLVWGVSADNLAAYNQAALRRFLEVFPEIDALQFRMHDESGLRKSEIQPFWHEVFASIRRTHPTLRLDLRAKELPDAVIDDAVAMGLKARVSTKYWMEQMGLPFHPTHINTQNQRDRRHGYADLLSYPQRYKVHWQLWSGGTTRVLLWGDPDYVRRFAESARIYDSDSFEINEMLATRMLGSAHTDPVVEILNPQYRYYDYEFERYWAFYYLWGRLTYAPRTDAAFWSDWEREFTRRFGAGAGPHLMRALQAASQVLPRVVASSYRYNWFPTTRGWAEMNHQDSLPKYATEEGTDIQQFLNLADEARRIIAGGDTPMRRPEDNSRWFADRATAVREEIARAGAPTSKEGVSTVADLKILAGLAGYHSQRLLAGVAYNLYRETGSLESFDDAIRFERGAHSHWREMIAAAGDVYSHDLRFGALPVGFRRHWAEEYALMTAELDELTAERAKATARPGAIYHPIPSPVSTGPRVTLEAPNGLVITARAQPDTVRSMRLRYRHMTQFEDYKTAEMQLRPGSDIYSARIPEGFADPKWALMYFVEVVDKQGSGRMYPDMDSEMPYVVIEPPGPAKTVPR